MDLRPTLIAHADQALQRTTSSSKARDFDAGASQPLGGRVLPAQRAHGHVMTGSHELRQNVDQICRSTVPRAAGVSEMVKQEKDVHQFLFCERLCGSLLS